MDKQQQIIQLRLRKLGLLIFDARNSARRNVQECADAIGVSNEKFQAFEKGEIAPSLPELENLAFFLDIPIEHFWGGESLSARIKPENVQQKEQLRKIRDRVIGVTLRAARTKLNFSAKELSLATLVPEEKINEYELGSCPVPLPELEIMAKALDLRVEDLVDQRGPIGKWRTERIETHHFFELNSELREFICTPVNLPYINLAVRLSQLSVEKLRKIAESILEITF
jgi:transcriptional regulator with XRE-family HTH domain